MSFLYLITIFVLLAVFIAGVFLQKRFRNQLLTNIIFCSSIVVLYGLTVIIAYIKNGPDDWNFNVTLPTANISPFIFATCPLFFVLPQSVRKYLGTLYALLVVGTIISPVATCIYNFSISYKFHLSFLTDYFAHIAMALWGVYLFHSEQCKLEIKDSLIGGSIIVAVAVIMMIINVIFDTSFFGLSLNGKHSIYNIRIVEDSYLSALIYFAGLGAALVAGYFLQRFLKLLITPKNRGEKNIY